MRSSNRLGWQKGYLNIFEKIRHSDNFAVTIALIADNPSESDNLLANLFAEFKIPPNLYAFIKNYAKTGQEDYSLIMPSIQIVSDFDKVAYPYTNPEIGYQIYTQSKLIGDKEIKIILEPDSNLDEVIQTLRLYRKEIESMRMNAVNAITLTPRRRSARKIDRNAYIKQLYDKGMKPKAIEKYLNDNENNPDNLTGPDISKIVHNMK